MDMDSRFSVPDEKLHRLAACRLAGIANLGECKQT